MLKSQYNLYETVEYLQEMVLYFLEIFYLLHTSIIQSATQYQVYIIILRLTWIL